METVIRIKMELQILLLFFLSISNGIRFFYVDIYPDRSLRGALSVHKMSL